MSYRSFVIFQIVVTFQCRLCVYFIDMWQFLLHFMQLNMCNVWVRVYTQHAFRIKHILHDYWLAWMYRELNSLCKLSLFKYYNISLL